MRLLICAALTATLAAAQTSMVVTAEPKHGAAAGPVNQNEVMVWQGNQRRQVLDWVPLQGDQAAMQLYILVDDAVGQGFANQLGDLRRFVRNQPSTTEVGVGYLSYGSVQIRQAPTADHDRAAQAFRIPLAMPGQSPSPYMSISELIRNKWPASSGRREILLIASGVDLYYREPDLQDPYMDAAITDAQRAGVIVYTIYWHDARGIGRGPWSTTLSQGYLTRLTDETGGKTWDEGLWNPVDIQPFLVDLNKRLNEQYRLSFATAGKPGLQPVRVETEAPGVKLEAARKA